MQAISGFNSALGLTGPGVIKAVYGLMVTGAALKAAFYDKVNFNYVHNVDYVSRLSMISVFVFACIDTYSYLFKTTSTTVKESQKPPLLSSPPTVLGKKSNFEKPFTATGEMHRDPQALQSLCREIKRLEFSKPYSLAHHKFLFIANTSSLKWMANLGFEIMSSSSPLKKNLISRASYLYIASSALIISIFRYAFSVLDYLPSLYFVSWKERREIRIEKAALNLQSSLIGFKGVISPQKAIENTIRLLWDIDAKSLGEGGVFFAEDRPYLADYAPSILAIWSSTIEMMLCCSNFDNQTVFLLKEDPLARLKPLMKVEGLGSKI